MVEFDDPADLQRWFLNPASNQAWKSFGFEVNTSKSYVLSSRISQYILPRQRQLLAYLLHGN